MAELWKVEELKNKRGETFALVVASDDEFICDMEGVSSRLPIPPEVLERAHRIAASPENAKVSMMVIEAFDRWGCVPEGVVGEAIRDAARSALARARGETTES